MALPEGSYTQTAYVVNNLEESAAHWAKVSGAGPWFISEAKTKNTIYRGKPSSFKFRIALAFLGASQLELVQILDDGPSVFKETLDKSGPGFNHICPQISGLSGDTFDERCREMERRGLQVAMTTEVIGTGRFAYYDALDSLGCFIEIVEFGKGYAVVPYIADLHLAWDGKEPIRKIETLFGKF